MTADPRRWTVRDVGRVGQRAELHVRGDAERKCGTVSDVARERSHVPVGLPIPCLKGSFGSHVLVRTEWRPVAWHFCNFYFKEHILTADF